MKYKYLLIGACIFPQGFGQGPAFSGSDKAAALSQKPDGAEILGSQAEALALLLGAVEIHQKLTGFYGVSILIRKKETVPIMLLHPFADSLILRGQIDPIKAPGGLRL